MAVIDWWNGRLTLVVIFFALCLLLLTWSIAGVACSACHSSGTFFHCDTHTHTQNNSSNYTHARTHIYIHVHTHAHTHLHTHTHTHTHTRTHTHKDTHRHAHTHTHTHTLGRTHTHTVALGNCVFFIYCNPGNFRKRLIFVLFVNSWNLWKLIAY